MGSDFLGPKPRFFRGGEGALPSSPCFCYRTRTIFCITESSKVLGTIARGKKGGKKGRKGEKGKGFRGADIPVCLHPPLRSLRPFAAMYL
jgi:hypothetical protein